MKYTEDIISEVVNEAYQNGDVQFEIKTDRCALIVIDMQDEFVKPEWTSSWIPEATRQVPKIRKLIDYCRSKDVPVIYTAFKDTHLFKDRPKTGELMPNRYPQLGNDPSWFKDVKVWHELAPQKDEIVIYKPSYGAFYDTPLETILKNLEKDTIIICGTLTNYCCGTTARQGYERGFKVIFGSDVTATDNPAMQEPELQVLRKGFAKVMDLEKIIESLR
ncbi:cysteine hydrolase family protein [Xanthovirga aplysinae]|uniref:cysteine hydrolase family protein n=1 Tax=Xanthovirga aplysinae TaxID=2529853 RepID=UPI0012BD3A62|nr:isochorismatase family cysteine hydrolase [Xanthovirga aplysinae]MTI33010.1 cysteine hydrolase [Xanthovirga aplysinae]